MDPACVDFNYRESVKNGEQKLLPLVMDLTNPSPALGWGHEERLSLADRWAADLVLALALVHHLALTNHLPFENMAKFFSRLCRNLVIEFVPKNDPQAQRLLADREDVFRDYDEKNFEESFGRYFEIVQRHPIQNSLRVLYLMRKK